MSDGYLGLDQQYNIQLDVIDTPNAPVTNVDKYH